MRIKTDSRKVTNGDTFVALRGIKSDGHDYIEKAIMNGASKIICEEGSYDVETLIVPDSRKYLEELLYEEYHDTLSKMNIIGLTGTNGKTTTAYLLWEALWNLDRPCSYIGTVGFYMKDKVRPLENTSPDICEIYDMLIESYENGITNVVMEVSSQGLSYGRFNGISFNYSLFTNLTQDHLDYHKTMENYALAKQELFKKTVGISLINNDDEYHEMFEIGEFKTYGMCADYSIKDIKLHDMGTDFYVNDIEVHSNLIGQYNVYNVTGVVALLDLLNISKEDIEKTIPKLLPPPGRMDRINYKNNIVVVDYAHTPDAMENVFKTIKEIPHNKTYIVFGCTGSRDSKKRPIMMQLALNNTDYVIVTSDDLHDEEFDNIVHDMLEGNELKHYEVEKDRSKAVINGIKLLKDKDILLVLGKGHEEYIIVGNDKIPFNDRKAIEEYIEQEKNLELV